MYDSQVRREVILDLQTERRARIRAILSNGGYLQTKEGLEARKSEIEQLNYHFDEAINHIMDPGKKEREQRAFENNPLFAAGIRGLERLKWDMMGSQMTEQLKKQGL